MPLCLGLWAWCAEAVPPDRGTTRANPKTLIHHLFSSLHQTILVTSPYSGPFYLGPSDNLFRGYPHFALSESRLLRSTRRSYP